MRHQCTVGIDLVWSSFTLHIFSFTGFGTRRTVKRIASDKRNVVPHQRGRHSRNCRGRLRRIQRRLRRTPGTHFWLMAGVSIQAVSLEGSVVDIARWLCSQNSLHMRLVLRTELGACHRVPKPVPVVLSLVLRRYDITSGFSRYPALRNQVWRILARVQAACSLFVYSGAYKPTISMCWTNVENSMCFESAHISPIVLMLYTLLILYITLIVVFDLRKGWAYSGVFQKSD